MIIKVRFNSDSMPQRGSQFAARVERVRVPFHRQEVENKPKNWRQALCLKALSTLKPRELTILPYFTVGTAGSA
jgi:hypothetical protein